MSLLFELQKDFDYIYTYDKYGNILSKYLEFSATYDKNDANLLSRNSQLLRFYDINYDNENIKEIKKMSKWVGTTLYEREDKIIEYYSEEEQFRYDVFNNIIYRYYNQGNLGYEDYKISYTYDEYENLNCIQITTTSNGQDEQYNIIKIDNFYNNNNKLVKRLEYGNIEFYFMEGNYPLIREYTYENDKLVYTNLTDSDSKFLNYSTYEYDEMGRINIEKVFCEFQTCDYEIHYYYYEDEPYRIRKEIHGPSSKFQYKLFRQGVNFFYFEPYEDVVTPEMFEEMINSTIKCYEGDDRSRKYTIGYIVCGTSVSRYCYEKYSHEINLLSKKYSNYNGVKVEIEHDL